MRSGPRQQSPGSWYSAPTATSLSNALREAARPDQDDGQTRPLIDIVLEEGGGNHGMQDAAVVKLLPDGRLIAVVADGVSAAARGGEAAKRAIAELVENLVGAKEPWSVEYVRETLIYLNRALAREQPLDQWKTTVAGLAITGMSAIVFHSGDSWVGRLSDDGAFARLTSPHSQAAEIERRGKAGPIAARILGGAALSACLGMSDVLDADVTEILVSPGSCFILATDGLDVLQKREIAAVLRTVPADRAAGALLKRARKRRLTDNTTVITIGIPPHPGTAIPSLRDLRDHVDTICFVLFVVALWVVILRDYAAMQGIPIPSLVTAPAQTAAPAQPDPAEGSGSPGGDDSTHQSRSGGSP